MAMVKEVKCTNGGVGRIFDDYIIQDPEKRRQQKAHAWRVACELWAAAQERKKLEEKTDVRD